MQTYLVCCLTARTDQSPPPSTRWDCSIPARDNVGLMGQRETSSVSEVAVIIQNACRHQLTGSLVPNITHRPTVAGIDDMCPIGSPSTTVLSPQVGEERWRRSGAAAAMV